MMRRLLLVMTVPLVLTLASPASAELEPESPYGSLWIGPRVGPGLGIRGPRGGYLLGLQLSYRTPYYFYYNLEVQFLHLLPRTITVDDTTVTALDGTETVIVPEHDVKVTGLYGVPITLEVGVRYDRGRARLRAGIGFGAMITVQTLESFGTDESEVIASFCFRPALGVDVVSRSNGGMVMIDLMYLWQDAAFGQTGDDNTVDTVLLTIGYSWKLLD